MTLLPEQERALRYARRRGTDSPVDEIRSRVGNSLAAKAPIEMVVRCTMPDGRVEPVTWLERFDWKAYAILLQAHNREHIAQVQRILVTLNAPSGD